MTQLVIGAGLLGRSLVDYLLEKGETVRVFDMIPYTDSRIETITGDVRNPQNVAGACAGVDTVYHTASMVSQGLGEVPGMYDVNVTGTQNVIAACRLQGVSRLVYTSSIDVVFDGTPIINGDESLPYPPRHLDYYGTTKMLAEQAVIQASDPQGLQTIVLRTAGIYGPHDRHRFPPILRNALKGVYTRLGDGRAKFNHVYVKNAAHAHWLAAQGLQQVGPPLGGQVYFITDHPPSNFFEFFLPFLEAANLPVKVRAVPLWLAQGMANAAELAYRLFPGDDNRASPQLTRYVVAATCQDFWFSHERASRDFGYTPLVSEEKAFQYTVDWIVNEWLPANQ
ncbi:MAG: NAD-dependent epimerase/dehydratase family protein [Anaerolineaceae bacterium]|nr:NAD-dependent epimerase/dehydratase family protein [Anaerolineaceae bacterium]